MKAIVFDGNSILNRAFYGVRPLSTADGTPTNACYGFVSIIRRAMSGDKYDFALMAFDMRAKTFRHEFYDGYKATRKGMPEELALQLPWAKKLSAALGLRVVTCEGFEADDILGSFSRVCDENEVECVIVTGDRDSYQLASDKTTVHLAATNETRIVTPDFIKAEYGLAPKQLIDVKALMGDSSDNIPGVPGIGEKGALKLMQQYGSLDEIYANAGEIKGSVGEKLRAGRESAYMSRYLAEINLHAPIDGDLETYRYGGEIYDDLKELYTVLEFKKFLDELSKPEGKAVEAEAETEYKYVSPSEIDTEERLLFACFDGDDMFVISGENAYSCVLDRECERLFGNKAITFCVWSVKDALHLLKARGIEPLCAFEDLSLMGYVLSPSDNGVFFPKLTLAYLNTEAKTDELPLYKPLYDEMKKRMSDEAVSLYRDIELPLAYTLFRMEESGFSVDKDGLIAYSAQLSAVLAQSEQAIYSLSGHEFNINSPKQLGTVLFEELGLKHGKKTKSGYSTGAEILEELRGEHPIIDLILEYRMTAKLKSTYCDGLLKVIGDDGLIHTTFKQTMTLTGRLSSAEPNLQNIPVRSDAGRVLRRFFVAREGNVLIDADYSQIELRVLAHLSGDKTLTDAFNNGTDIHTLTASQVFGVPPQSVSGEMRKRAKVVNFGIIYGMGAYTLSRDLHVSLREASAYIEGYFARYPGVEDYMTRLVDNARRLGYVDTMMGRRRYVPELAVANRQLRSFGERVAKNTPIQGSAADIIKKAMIDVERALEEANLKSRLILQIHDELIVEAPIDEADEARGILISRMENAVKLKVPLTVSAGTGKSWFDAKD